MEGFKILGVVAIVLFATPAHANPNQYIKDCLAEQKYSVEQFDTFDFNRAAKCASDYRTNRNTHKLAEMRAFLHANPRYRVPGQSQNRCWGKPRESAFESAYIEKTGDGFRAGVSYKDTMPAGCYENGPWDNRNVQD